MAGSKNQVTLTLAGDSTQLEKTFDRVGASAEEMGGKVRDSSDKFEKTAEGFGTADTRAMGFRDTITGVQDSVSGFSKILSGDFSGKALLLAGMGIGDLASGMENFIVPALAKMKLGWIGMKVQAALAWLAALGPIPLIIAGLAALAVGIVLLWKHSETFRNIVKGAFNAVWGAIKAVWNWTKHNWPLLLAILTGPIGLAVLAITRNWGRIKSAGVSVWNWISALPGRIAGAFRRIGAIIAAPFRAGFNAVRNAWNSTVGGKGFTVPSWVPVIGGQGFHIPYFHTGGIVGGTGETLAMLKGGEGVFTREQMAAMGGGGAARLVVDVTGADRDLVKLFRKMIRSGGGDVQIVMGTE